MNYLEYIKLYDNEYNISNYEYKINNWINKYKKIDIDNKYFKIIKPYTKYIHYELMYNNTGYYDYFDNIIWIDSDLITHNYDNSILYFYTVLHEICHMIGKEKYIKHAMKMNVLNNRFSGYERRKEELTANLFTYLVLDVKPKLIYEILKPITNINNLAFGKIKNKKDYNLCFNEAKKRYEQIEKYIYL